MPIEITKGQYNTLTHRFMVRGEKQAKNNPQYSCKDCLFCSGKECTALKMPTPAGLEGIGCKFRKDDREYKFMQVVTKIAKED